MLRLLEGVGPTYDGPQSLATDNMVWNTTKTEIRERTTVSPDHAWSVPGPTRPPKPPRGEAPPVLGATSAVVLAPEGSKPCQVMADGVMATAEITAIDAHAHQVTLELREGSGTTLKVGRHVDLTQVALGNSGSTRITETVAIEFARPRQGPSRYEPLELARPIGMLTKVEQNAALCALPDERKTRYGGQRKVGWVFAFAAAAYNLVRMRNLAVAT